ncbi:Hypothetical protein IALB_2537 [Ignavibacterium album JCM 16511]|uniref:Flagellar hook-length control protein-like C-terminal domain-containing protein n=1 Tax=Ignavibacterium album (strain DSM 19864 / JCM 16511 / NBRC 101810 / Mat9-16) TaxID=945713 RepID=I0AMN3_IGNAJ|nr:flagellar hook-length control protein FliK [Ignavibacterium album]AFH50240.1 Hypothetical protein IALB_2537 [Ignavibacterium album JCM 16511]
MFINSLFLSKLLNLKSEKQSSGVDENGFSHLFSEIIKIKSAGEDTAFLPEYIGGTLLDHKTIFISNSSPLENKTFYRTDTSIKIIEELYKLFTSGNLQLITVSENQAVSLNKITTDKNQFLKSIETLIQNILSDSDNQNKEVEIRYVSKNLIETKKINKENLSQFSEYLSKLIDGNQSFSFVIGANLKQILFDVENLTSNEEAKTNVQVEAGTESSSLQNMIPGSTEHIQSVEASKLKTELNENYLKNETELNDLIVKSDGKENLEPRITNQNINEKIIPSVNDNSNQKSSFSMKENLKPDFKQNSDNKILLQVFNKSEKTNDYTKVNSRNSLQQSEIDVDKTSENNFSNKISKLEDETAVLKVNKERQTSNSVSTNLKSSEPEVKVKIEGEIKNQSSVQQQKNDEANLKFEDIAEIKIVIKEKSQFVHSEKENQVFLRNSQIETYKKEPQSVQTNPKNESQDFRNVDLADIPGSYRSIRPELTEKDLQTIIKTQADEPKISRAGLPLIADYQDWDLIFDKSSNQVENVFENDQTFIRQTSEKEVMHKLKSEFSPDNQKETEVRTNSINSKFKIDLDKPAEQKTIQPNEIIEDLTVRTNQKEKMLHLQFSGEKKIIAVSEPVQEKVISFSDAKTQTVVEQNNSINENSTVNVDSNKSSSSKNLNEHKPIAENEIKIQNGEANDRRSTDNQNQSGSENKNFASEVNKVSNEKDIPDEKAFKSDLMSLDKQVNQPEIKSHLFNNKNIVEHFIKNPVESKTLEKFLQFLDKQEIIQKSEIVNYSKQNHSVEIKLSPKELGSIKILLDTNDNNVSAKIEVGNEQTKAVVVNNLPQLKETLSQQGVNLNNVNVTVSSEEQRNPEQTKQKNKKKSQDNNPKVEFTEEKKTVRNLGYNTYEYLV